MDAAGALLDAMQDLYQNMRPDKTALQSVIDAAESLLGESDTYVPASVSNLTAKLNAAKTVHANASATQAEVDGAYTDLRAALNNMFEKGDKARLQVLVSITAFYREASYTPATWGTFSDAKDGAAAMLANVNAVQTYIDAAYTALYDALQNLARRANFSTLQTVVNTAQLVVDNIDDYVPGSVAGLADALAAAKLVAGDLNSTQAQVNAAAATLNAELLKARLKPDRSALLSMQSRARSLSRSIYTAASIEPLDTAMTRADEVLNASDEDITQEDVDAATNALANAIAGLQPKPIDAVDDGAGKTTSGVTDVTDATDKTTGATPGDASAGKTDSKTDGKADGKADSNSKADGKAKTDSKAAKDSAKSGSKSKTATAIGTSGGDASAGGNAAASNAAADNAAADSAAAADDAAAAATEEPAIVADAAPGLTDPIIIGGGEEPTAIADEAVPTASPKAAFGIPTGWLITILILAAIAGYLSLRLYIKRKKENNAA
jgi:hypothetical protein